MMRTLFLQAPSFDGFDGGAGSRYQTKREVASFWYPHWLAQPAALVENSKLIDAPPHRIKLAEVTAQAKNYDLAVLHTHARRTHRCGVTTSPSCTHPKSPTGTTETE